MSDRNVFCDSVLPLPPQPGPTPEGVLLAPAQQQHGDEMMDVHFSLALAPGAQQQLEARVAKGEVVPAAELDKIYTSKPADADALKAWLKAQGFTITHSTADGIYARAKVGQIARSLDVNMGRVTKDGVTYNGASNAPSPPSEVAASVQSINGLQPFRQANKRFRELPPADGNRMSALAAGPAPKSGAFHCSPGYDMVTGIGAPNVNELMARIH